MKQTKKKKKNSKRVQVTVRDSHTTDVPRDSTQPCIYRGDGPVNILGQATWSETSYRAAPLCYKCRPDVESDGGEDNVAVHETGS